MNRKQKLTAMIRDLSEELNAIKNAEDAKENEAFLGRCFRVRNNYSCPQTEDDYWWLYCVATEIKDGCLFSVMFQDDNKGRFTIETDRLCMPQTLNGYEEISRDDFLKAWTAFLAKVSALKVTA